MVGRGKSKQARVNELSSRLKEDRISQLPDHLILYHILDHLPIKDLVTTSVLSTRWRSLWLSVPCLKLKSRKFSNSISFVSFGDMFFNSDPASKTCRKLIIYLETFKVIHHYSKVKPLPQFDYMSRLEITLFASDLKWLPTFLEHCPNLKSLELVLDHQSRKIYSKERNQISFSAVPQCFFSSLEFVEITNNIRGYAADMFLNLVSYFLENSAILKKLNLHSCSNDRAYKYIFKKLLSIPRRSPGCALLFSRKNM
ncbi:putative FBD-associated F-box protein At5g53635 [Arabidopsis lyrata subsp. lyrata]|uniref:putative FBD-associated F-box protein At5g53635 n=1 Tax=Arabidopsis lyrata subsp. lyrata TaxID=81972 RepID=UPI000A29DCE2|nr:putative FBD-associated F-box protein At5g53635 [Arabidopsis lyrata subsp. lyrata]|eukprot:XP_020871441.1 putative FBD-associated F-box protein At5g53635 [Arabidopsis lyrata subsp. lyrata]